MKHSEYFVKFKKLCESEDFLGFYKLYLEYLRVHNIESPSRHILYSMTQKLVKKLEDESA